jgi:hypothetical protein
MLRDTTIKMISRGWTPTGVHFSLSPPGSSLRT